MGQKCQQQEAFFINVFLIDITLRSHLRMCQNKANTHGVSTTAFGVTEM